MESLAQASDLRGTVHFSAHSFPLPIHSLYTHFLRSCCMSVYGCWAHNDDLRHPVPAQGLRDKWAGALEGHMLCKL